MIDELFPETDPRFASSAIRELLVHARQPHVISLAGGLPAPELLATEQFRVAVDDVLTSHGAGALQYGLSEGEPPLRERLAAAASDGAGVAVEQLLVTAGSQQALDLGLKVMASKPNPVAVVEEPGYVGAIQALRANGYQLEPIPVDAAGMQVDILADRLEAGLRPTVCYTNPTFQNPTGAVLSPERGERLIELAERYHFLIISDDPYVELWLGSARPASPLRSDTGAVLHLGSMSKTLSPGVRVGWATGPRPLIERMAMAKQAADLQTATINQLVVARILEDETWWAGHLDALRNRYRTRRTALLDAMSTQWPEAEVQRQNGGFFLWLSVPDADPSPGKALDAAIDVGVAYVPGNSFTSVDGQQDKLRLSYSSADPTTFDEGIKRLRTVLG